ncbi:cysteine proteinase [Jaminaea rosea]|uniref:Cysteine proteinase n=1 Tax=Jaminaea rosea TaxID=1569628 RepID=A0A316UXZ6_9BASI|nr:cysteine proteinase [Jaminaea rosea]PWN29864.1 cysteine proteinase [Jaminaea rosea]
MPGKKKKKSSSSNRPEPHHTDSLRADIAAANDEDVDIASELLASLDARDEAEERVKESVPPPSKPLEVPSAPAHHHQRSSLSSETSGSSGTSGGGLMSGLKGAGEKIRNHVSPNSQQGQGHSPTSPRSGGGLKGLFGGGGEGGEKKVGRQKARKQRKEATAAAERARFEEELKANGGNVDEAEEERQGMSLACDSLNVDLHEITPDGHCLYSAVADQLRLAGLGGYDYQGTRKVTAEYMRRHRDDFLPFISDIDESMAGIKNEGAGNASKDGAMEEHYLRYCDAIESTGVWGGQPEILAMSRAFKSQIWVVQAGQPIVKVGEGEEKGGPLMISYHRRMYGLGEHYNSLHPRKK